MAGRFGNTPRLQISLVALVDHIAGAQARAQLSLDSLRSTFREPTVVITHIFLELGPDITTRLLEATREKEWDFIMVGCSHVDVAKIQEAGGVEVGGGGASPYASLAARRANKAESTLGALGQFLGHNTDSSILIVHPVTSEEGSPTQVGKVTI